VVILCFAGAVSASSLPFKDAIPTAGQVISYFNQARLTDFKGVKMVKLDPCGFSLTLGVKS